MIGENAAVVDFRLEIDRQREGIVAGSTLREFSAPFE